MKHLYLATLLFVVGATMPIAKPLSDEEAQEIAEILRENREKKLYASQVDDIVNAFIWQGDQDKATKLYLSAISGMSEEKKAAFTNDILLLVANKFKPTDSRLSRLADWLINIATQAGLGQNSQGMFQPKKSVPQGR